MYDARMVHACMYGACVYDAANFVTDILLMGGAAAAAGANRGTMGLGCWVVLAL